MLRQGQRDNFPGDYGIAKKRANGTGLIPWLPVPTLSGGGVSRKYRRHPCSGVAAFVMGGFVLRTLSSFRLPLLPGKSLFVCGAWVFSRRTGPSRRRTGLCLKPANLCAFVVCRRPMRSIQECIFCSNVYD